MKGRICSSSKLSRYTWPRLRLLFAIWSVVCWFAAGDVDFASPAEDTDTASAARGFGDIFAPGDCAANNSRTNGGSSSPDSDGASNSRTNGSSSSPPPDSGSIAGANSVYYPDGEPTCAWIDYGEFSSSPPFCDAQVCGPSAYSVALTTPSASRDANQGLQEDCLRRWIRGEKGVYDKGTTCNVNLMEIIGCTDSSCAADAAEHARRGQAKCAGLSKAQCKKPAPCAHSSVTSRCMHTLQSKPAFHTSA